MNGQNKILNSTRQSRRFAIGTLDLTVPHIETCVLVFFPEMRELSISSNYI